MFTEYADILSVGDVWSGYEFGYRVRLCQLQSSGKQG